MNQTPSHMEIGRISYPGPWQTDGLKVLFTGNPAALAVDLDVDPNLIGIGHLETHAVAIYSTKIVTLAKNGFWGTLHEARMDISMLLGLIFLLAVRGGAWSLDAWLAERRDRIHG